MPGRKKRGTNTGIPGLSFSFNRAAGITKAKRKIAKKIKIPTTKSGRQRKIGQMAGGCLLPVFLVILFIFFIIFA